MYIGILLIQVQSFPAFEAITRYWRWETLWMPKKQTCITSMAAQIFQAQCPNRQMPDHSIFQLLHRQLSETDSFHLTKHEGGRRRTILSPRLEESIFNIVADEPKSSTRAVTHQEV